MKKEQMIALNEAIHLLECAGFEGGLIITNPSGSVIKTELHPLEWKKQAGKSQGLVASILSVFGWGK